VFPTCTNLSITFNAYNCETTHDVQAFLNVLVDWNEDGDWNDNFSCTAGGACANEWAVKNSPIVLTPGCGVYTSPTFLTGPNNAHGWMRISISSEPVPDDFPWNGTVSMPGSAVKGGETEDYPVEIHGQTGNCQIQYKDFGDAPEGFAAYPSG